MVKRSMVVFHMLLVMSSVAFGKDRTTIFEGLNMTLVSVVDSMNDEKGRALFVKDGPLYFNLYGNNNFTITAEESTRLFAQDANHLIRIGE